ncbi:hypothetical protein INO08_15220, partial [Staphylococcus aureus]|nr:hypothetical protein [Staphylococcus aureus]
MKEAVGAAKWLVEYAYAHHLPEAVSKRQAAVEVSAARRLRFRAATAKAMRRLQ